MERRLAAILVADVVGYSRLMGEDEEGTLASLSHLRKDLIEPLIAEHHGRVVKLMGDGILVEFASVVDAVNCAVVWQKDMAEEDLRFRIGVNIGEIIIEDGDIYGNGVNVAARLEPLADPGGICLSGSVHDEVKHKLKLVFEDLGEQTVKNIEEPVRAYRVVLDGGVDMTPRTPDATPAKPSGKPSVAVLPFDSMSEDPEQESFVDGVTEDIITALSRTRWYDVTARNSTFTYKGKSPDVRDVGKALGVNYVLEGSVRKSGNKMRITVQLIDAATGNHVWADRYDRGADDEFALQDEIARRVSSALNERIWQDVAQNFGQKAAEDYVAYDYAFSGIKLIHKIDPIAVVQAEEYLLKALEFDPDLFPGNLGLGFCKLATWTFWGDEAGTALEEAERYAKKVLDIAPDDANIYRLLSRIYSNKEMYEESWRCVERALSINPNDGDIIANRGSYHLFQGDFDEATIWFDEVLELHADTPFTVDIMRFWKALTSFVAKDYEAAVTLLGSVTDLEFIKAELLCACHASLGQDDKAQSNCRSVLEVQPEFRLSNIGLWKSFRQQADRQHLYDALLKSGLPD